MDMKFLEKSGVTNKSVKWGVFALSRTLKFFTLEKSNRNYVIAVPNFNPDKISMPTFITFSIRF